MGAWVGPVVNSTVLRTTYEESMLRRIDTVHVSIRCILKWTFMIARLLLAETPQFR